MWDKLFGYVGLPIFLDLLGKVHLTDAAEAAFARIKEQGEEAFRKYRRQALLWLVGPLLTFHLVAAIVHAIVWLIATWMTWNSEGTSEKFLWLGSLLVSVAIHAWLYRRLPPSPEFALDADGEIQRFPEFFEGTQEPHTFAGQPILAENYKLDRSKVSLSLSVGMSILAGFLTSIPLLMLSMYTGRRGFIFLSLVIAGLSIFSLNFIAKLFNWGLVKGARLAERGIGFVFMQVAILAPHVQKGDVTVGVADNLIPEQDFLPWYIRTRNLIVDIYLSFVLGLLISVKPEMFQWIAFALAVIAITGYFMTRYGMKDEVVEQQRKFWRHLFYVVGPAVIVMSFLRFFRPEQAEKIASMAEGLLTGTMSILGFITSPCEHIVQRQPMVSLVIAAALGWITTKVYGFWSKASGRFIRTVSFAGMCFIGYIGIISAYSSLIHYRSEFNLCKAPVVAQAAAVAPSASATVVEEPIKKEEEKKENAVTEEQTLAMQTVANQQQIALKTIDVIGFYLHDLIPEEFLETKLESLRTLRESVVKLGTQIELSRKLNQALSPEGMESLARVQKQLEADTNKLQDAKIAIVDGTLASIPDKWRTSFAKIKQRTESSIVSLRAAQTLVPADPKEAGLAERRRVAAETAIKLAAMKEPKPVSDEAESESMPHSVPAAKKSGSKECLGCVSEFDKVSSKFGVE